MKKTLAEFKRECQTRQICLELVERFGKTGSEIPARCRGVREIFQTNTVGVLLVNSEGEKSELSYPAASLFEYNGNSIIIYERGERNLTEQEKSILAQWKSIEEEYFRVNPCGDSFWKCKNFFETCPCPWLSGFSTVKGKTFRNGKVIDSKIRGKAILKYIVHRL